VGKELKKVEAKVEETRRVLGLVETTEQQLAALGGAGDSHESEARDLPVEAGTKVRRGATANATRLA
jgi:hypothetical protein